MAHSAQGDELLAAAERLVLDVIRASDEGLTNMEVARETGLYLPVSRQRGYISWTILQHLVETGRLERRGPRYRLAGGAAAR
jgi:hypothetical protein